MNHKPTNARRETEPLYYVEHTDWDARVIRFYGPKSKQDAETSVHNFTMTPGHSAKMILSPVARPGGDHGEVRTMRLPEKFAVDHQPYGRYVLTELRVIPGRFTADDYAEIEGVVTEGTERSRLFHTSSTRSIVGERRTVYGVRQHELDSGRCVRVAS